MNKRRNFMKKALLTGLGVAGLTSGAQARGRRANLTKEQKDEIFFMYQEEKVARDVYITLGKIYPEEDTFASIQFSEQRHIDAVEGLCDKYGISKDGVNEGEVGNFVLPELQAMYNDLVLRGESSLMEALRVGELIELSDIKDLEEAIKMFDGVNDVINVFSNLKEGSTNHLEAFQRAIARES